MKDGDQSVKSARKRPYVSLARLYLTALPRPFPHDTRPVSPRGRRVVRSKLRRADAGAGRGWPAIKAGRERADRRADRLGQDAGGVSRARSTGWCGKGSAGELEDETQVVYVSPLKALSNDIQRNLEVPLAGIREALARAGPARCRDPHLGAHRRHAAGRARSACADARRTSSSRRRSRSTSCSARSRAARCWRPRAP